MTDKYDPDTYHHHYANVNGIRMHYIDENPSSQYVLLLLHGWPDIWIGWREQILFLSKLGYRVIVPSLRGYGETDAPEDSSTYNVRTISADLALLLDRLAIPEVTVIGHDWGGMVAWRFSQFYPQHVVAVASFCTPYLPPSPIPLTLEDIVSVLPNFNYQLYLRTPDAEKEISKELPKFFCRLFQPVDNTDPPVVDPNTNRVVEGRKELPRNNQLLPPKVLEYYVKSYSRPGAVQGSLNWYKQTENNYEACRLLDANITHPSLMVVAEKDITLPVSMTEDMPSYIENLEIVTIMGSGHWILWEKPKECNETLQKWLGKVFPVKPVSKL